MQSLKTQFLLKLKHIIDANTQWCHWGQLQDATLVPVPPWESPTYSSGCLPFLIGRGRLTPIWRCVPERWGTSWAMRQHAATCSSKAIVGCLDKSEDTGVVIYWKMIYNGVLTIMLGLRGSVCNKRDACLTHIVAYIDMALYELEVSYNPVCGRATSFILNHL